MSIIKEIKQATADYFRRCFGFRGRHIVVSNSGYSGQGVDFHRRANSVQSTATITRAPRESQAILSTTVAVFHIRRKCTFLRIVPTLLDALHLRFAPIDRAQMVFRR